MTNKAKSLALGLNPTSYMGVTPQQVPALIVEQRSPTNEDRVLGQLGSLWVVNTGGRSPTFEVWVLVDLTGGEATWVQLFPGAGSSLDFVTDAGTATPVAGVINVLGGSNMNTAGAGNTVTINLDTSISQPTTNASGTQGLYSLGGHTFLHNYGVAGSQGSNTFVGTDAGNLTNTSNPGYNTGIGDGSLLDLTTGNYNSTLGGLALSRLTDGSTNVAVGTGSLEFLVHGNGNTALGYNSGSNYTGSEAGNLLLDHTGVLGESDATHIGSSQTTAFIAGVAGVTVANTNFVTIDTVTGQLGSQVGSGGGGTTQFTTDDANVVTPTAGNVNLHGGSNINTTGSGDTATFNLDNNVTISGTYTTTGGNVVLPATTASAGILKINSANFLHAYGTRNTFVGTVSGDTTLTGADNTGIGDSALGFLTSGAGNTAVGSESGLSLSSGFSNVAVGNLALNSETTGNAQTAIGTSALENILGGTSNVAVGCYSLQDATSGGDNVAVGYNSLSALLTGGGNIAIGVGAGISYVGAESDNILIGNTGTAAESNVIRIGTQGTQTSAYMAGIAGVTVANEQMVTINSSTGQLGVLAGTPVPNYSTGTWTPVIKTGGAAPTGVSYTNQTATFTKIGNCVNFWVQIYFTCTSFTVGGAVIDGLPFTPVTPSGWAGGFVAYPCVFLNVNGGVTMDAGFTYLLGGAIPTATYIALYECRSAGTGSQQLANTNLSSAGTNICLQGQYFTAS